MIIVGLTGSIGMGKSEATKMFRCLGVPVFDADAAVHEIMGPGGRAVKRVEATFPGVTAADGSVDRVKLGSKVFGKPDELRKLEAILHPMVGQMQRQFLAGAARARHNMVVLDIPLLFEGRGEERCDLTAVVSAPPFIQRHRVLARANMTKEKFVDILNQQVPDRVKRLRADVVLPTGLGKAYTLNRIRDMIAKYSHGKGTVWPPRKMPAKRPSHHPSRRPIHDRHRIRAKG
jgi:dephospho-CoA kinase